MLKTERKRTLIIAIVNIINNPMTIQAIKIMANDLQPGDLFSTAGPEYWGNIKHNRSLGEKVYIRTDEPSPADQDNVELYKITINK